jgi:threonine dehydrogenase-like Zn-dependent dehydrogenase
LNRTHASSVHQVSTHNKTQDRVLRFNLIRAGGSMSRVAFAFWVCAPGAGEIRHELVPEPGPGEVLVRTLRSGVSRGTETLVFTGHVPVSQYRVMRAPHQQGDLPGPVKYGYLNVGVVEQGPSDLQGRTVFCLYPHQSMYVVPADAVTVLPEDVPPARAVLAGTVETALNALWDAAPLLGDRMAVVGGGVVGCCVARLLARIPGTRVTLVDIDPSRRDVAAALGVDFALPDEAKGGLDLVVHTSATSAGLQTSLDLLAAEGTVLELSWYGDQQSHVALGAAFHSGRLTIRASQVGTVAASRRGRRTARERLELALELLRDPAFDALLSGWSPFEELPEVMAQLASRQLDALCHTLVYDHPVAPCSA